MSSGLLAESRSSGTQEKGQINENIIELDFN
jgi:hypothetical protein